MVQAQVALTKYVSRIWGISLSPVIPGNGIKGLGRQSQRMGTLTVVRSDVKKRAAVVAAIPYLITLKTFVLSC